MTVYHLLTLNHQTIPSSANLKRQRAKESEPKNHFRLSVSTNPTQVRTEYKPNDKPYKVFCANPPAILCTSLY